VEYFVFGKDAPGTASLRWERTEAHWDFMDGYAPVLIARGPTLTDDGENVTGSMHIVELPDHQAAHAFAFDEPYFAAGVFRDVLLRRWSNELGRTMWQFSSRGSDPRFLVLGHGQVPGTDISADLHLRQSRYLSRGHADQLIVHGPLLTPDASRWLGTATLVELPDRGAAASMLSDGPYAEVGLYDRVEVHRWRFGGRPAADAS
jgi:uncharacterized protein YciI